MLIGASGRAGEVRLVGVDDFVIVGVEAFGADLLEGFGFVAAGTVGDFETEVGLAAVELAEVDTVFFKLIGRWVGIDDANG